MTTKQSSFHDYPRLLRYLRPYLGSFIIAAIGMAVISAAAGGTAMLMQPLMDDIFIKKDNTILAMVPVAIILLYLVRGVGRYFASMMMQRIGQQSVRDIRNDLYAHMQSLSLSFYHRQTTGKLVSRIVNDVNVLQESVSIVVYDLVREGLTAIALLAVLVYRDPKLSLFVLLTFPFAGAFIGKLGRRLRAISRNSQETMADLTSLMNEAFSGVRVVKAFAMEKYETERFKAQNESYYLTMLKTIRINEMSSPLLEFIGAFAVGGIIWYGGSQVIAGTTTVGAFFSFLTALFMIFAPITKLSRVYNKIQQAMGATGRIFEILDIKPEIADLPDARPLPPVKREVRFEKVSFAYNDEPVLREIELTVPTGAMCAIVGMSGAGKSTLVDLIPRFYDPAAGRILIDGADIRHATVASLRAQIGIVTQEVFLFNDTIRNNISYGHGDIPRERIEAAARAAYAHDFIMEMPNGYETMIGERGARLSGGQRQRISIARALLKDPAILILDEATSALDTKSEIEVQKALNNLMRNRTTFVIAHRLSTIQNANLIIVLDRGAIVERGTHTELLAHGGHYRRVYEMQFTRHAGGN